MSVHPLDDLSVAETAKARDIIVSLHPGELLYFRDIALDEPAKAVLRPYLEVEKKGKPGTPPHRCALVQYDVIGADKKTTFHESFVDLNTQQRTSHEVIGNEQHAALTLAEFDNFVSVCNASPLYQEAIAQISLPAGFEHVLEPWPYGGLLPEDGQKRYFQGLCFAKRASEPDSNFYAFPVPIIPVMDAEKQEIIRIDRLAVGGKGDSLVADSTPTNPVDHCVESDYIPELLPNGVRTDLKPLNVIQPLGPSFSIKGKLVEWQGWSFRVGFTPREGAVLHNLWFKGRSVMHRLSVSEMTVPYADARYPAVRKQAFDFGDGGAGNYANNLSLGCDCLGVIKYFDGVIIDPSGTPKVHPNVVCLHEQDNGIGWKHTNWRTQRAVVTRLRELVVQFIITLANYEYVFAYKLDQAGGITVETRATGIVNIVNIAPGKVSDYGNVVSPGALAQNHQHLFAFRLDFAVDGSKNTVVVEESHPVKRNPETSPYGNYYEVRNTPVKESCWLDANPKVNRLIKVVNPDQLNPVSQRPVGYKFTPLGTQLLLADPGSLQESRAQFATHHVWVTKHKDRELYAGGRFTLQSTKEVGGVSDAAARKDKVENEDVVVWSVFGLTHNPRVEDWPVMPVEIHGLHIKPVDFFTENPAIDVPSNKNLASVLTEGSQEAACCPKPSL